MEEEFDLIILGAGSGGLAAAKRAAKHGARVAIIEGDQVGGTCVIRGCVPKKLLVYGSMYTHYINCANSYGFEFQKAHFDSSILLKNVREEVHRLNKIHIESLKKLNISIEMGWGRFIDANRIEIRNLKSNATSKILKAKYILIAVGGRPSPPNIPGIDKAWLSDDLFLQESFPDKIVVIGAGYIACEFCCILNNLGVKVMQIIRGDRLLKGFDYDLSNILQDYMQGKGIELLFRTTPLEIKDNKHSLSITTNSSDEIHTKAILAATGRKPFIQGLQLDKSGVEINKGKIPVNDFNQTNISNIYAVGDVTDRFNLTPVAIDEGRAFADSLFGTLSRKVNYSLIPSAVFSQPEIASVGVTEQNAIEIYGKENIKIYRAKFKSMSQALPKKGAPCLLKLIVHLNDEKILGCHMVGEHAAEIIQMSSIAINMGATKTDFDNTMALHPTIAEEFVTMI